MTPPPATPVPGVAFYQPDIEALRATAADAAPATPVEAASIIDRSTGPGAAPLSLRDLAALVRGMSGPGGAAVADLVCEAGAVTRRRLFGDAVVPMAPIEISNTCASDCLFCGWRVSNRAMKRLKMPADLAMIQVEYLVDQGIRYIEFVSGDDIAVVRDLMPTLIRETRALFDRRGVTGKIAFCTLALTEGQYADLREAGADAMVVWQEAYDPAVFRQHVAGGPKAFGITDGWKVDRGGDGCRFRIESQERALRAGLEVALGSMLGLNPDLALEFLATVDHARALHERHPFTPEHPLIIGMPIWNAITTPATDLRPDDAPGMTRLFPALAALYLLALPIEGNWVFPNCRVPLPVQIEAARVAGAFSSTEVKLGPGGYLPEIIRTMEARGDDATDLRRRVIATVREGSEQADVDALQRLLDEREQFLHHHHGHGVYMAAMAEAGLRVVDGVEVPDPAIAAAELI